MSVDLKRVRESHQDAVSPASKKRALGGASPRAEEETGVEDWMKVVETHRKEAIYRQMLEYKRASQEAARKVRQLEEQKRRLEASEHAVEVCWTQLVTVIQELVGQQQAQDSAQALEPIIEPELSQPALEAAIQTRLPATKQLVSRFVEVAKQGKATPSDTLQRCAKLQTESTTLRAMNQSLRAEIANLSQSRDQYRSDLVRAEKRIDKQRMDHDKAEAEWRAQDRDRPATPGVRPNGPVSGHATPNGKSEHDVKPVLDAAAGMLQDSAELERLAATRQEQLDQLREEHRKLTLEADRLRQLAQHPSEEALRTSPFFQVHMRILASQAGELAACRHRFETAEGKLDELRNQNFEFRDAVLAEGKAEAEVLRAQNAKQNSDMSRLRGQRDDLQAEMTQARMREESRLKVVEEVERLSNAREERVVTLVSEVTRLKGRLGAEHGSRTYLDFVRREGIDADYVRDLEVKLQSRSSDPGLVALEEVQAELARYKRILGPDSQAATDATALAVKLEEAIKEREALQMQVDESTLSTNALYSEVESLAKMADLRTTQLASKVFDLREADGRMARLTTEKAKADNKYFQAMRAKEAVEAEARTAQRSVDKQARLIEKAAEVERALQAQVAAQEKGLTSFKNDALALQTQLASVTSEKVQLDLRLQQSQAALADAQAIMRQRVDEAAAEKALRIKRQEEAEKATSENRKLLERQEQLLAHSGGDVSASELQMREERDKLLKLLRCSCCEQNFKQQVITKCMHTFCKQCLETRIATRQRKCPACGIGFAISEVQTLYWQ